MSETLKMLPVKLDMLETQQRAKELAELLHKIETSEDAEAERRRQSKDAMESMKTKASELGRIVRTGQESRPTLVTEHANTERWTMDYIRLDTGEVYESRPMSATEREKAAQLALWGGPVEKAEPKAANEPGRNDPLPEAADTKKGKRQATKAEKVVAAAADDADRASA